MRARWLGAAGWAADLGSQSDHRGLADSDTTLLLPFEVAKDLGPVALDCDFGHSFSSKSTDAGWAGGILVGREVAKGWELDAEAHVNASEGLGREEWIVNGGTRIDLSESVTLMLALGRDLANPLGPRISLLTQLRL